MKSNKEAIREAIVKATGQRAYMQGVLPGVISERSGIPLMEIVQYIDSIMLDHEPTIQGVEVIRDHLQRLAVRRVVALPGCYISASGNELYDVGAHIQRAFETEPVGKALRVKQVRDLGQREEMPDSLDVGIGPIKARMQGIAEGRSTLENIVCNYDHEGILIAYKMTTKPIEQAPDEESVEEPITSLSDPRVSCCKRDAADCDCGPLEKMYAEARDLHGDKATEIEDHAREAAISLIIDGGFDSTDSDLLGQQMGGIVQAHLMIAFMRQPEMIENLVNNGNLVL